MRSDISISVKNLTKTYRIFSHPGDRIKQALTFGRIRLHREFTALQDVSFEIKKGETVGIIGRNGSGKSTLLQLICGILKPTSGTVKVNGRVSALLELGAGFHPEFTGRENVYFQGAVLGITKEEMDRKFDDIAAFADIGEFIEEPVRTYSSGMFVRLAFAVAISVDPDILVVDEALAVGDANFQAKCFRRINDIQKRGGTILIVTHAAEQVAHFCSGATLLDKGRIITSGTTTKTLARYIELLNSEREEKPHNQAASTGIPDDPFHLHPAYNPHETRWGDRAVTIVSFRIAQDGQESPSAFIPGLPVELDLQISFHADINKPIYGLTIKTSDNIPVLTTNSRELADPTCPMMQKSGDNIRIRFTFYPFLDAGDYRISVGIASETPSGILPHDRRYDAISFQVRHPVSPFGKIDMRTSFNYIERQIDSACLPKDLGEKK